MLAETYELLEHALVILKNEGDPGFLPWTILHAPYLGDPGDPSLVEEWHKKKRGYLVRGTTTW
jgi:hypothetical protein